MVAIKTTVSQNLWILESMLIKQSNLPSSIASWKDALLLPLIEDASQVSPLIVYLNFILFLTCRVLINLPATV